MNSHASPKPVYQHLHAFRTFAILNIVAAHTWVSLILFGHQGETPDHLQSLVFLSESLFHNGTIYFAIISGILYSLVLKRYSWRRFYWNKSQYVAAPYLIFTLLFSYLFTMVLLPPNQTPITFLELLKALPDTLLNGSAMGHLWYIPVLLFLFIITPALNWVAERTDASIWVAVFCFLPLFISRQWPDNVWQNFVFFIGPYLLGIYMGSRYKESLALIRRFQLGLWCITLLSLPLLYWLYSIELPAQYGIKLQESVSYFQKIAISLIVLQWFEKRDGQSSKITLLIANYSFSLYFVHNFFIGLISLILPQALEIDFTVASTLFYGTITYLGALLLSLFFTFLVKKLSGRYSRMIIGS